MADIYRALYGRQERPGRPRGPRPDAAKLAQLIRRRRVNQGLRGGPGRFEGRYSCDPEGSRNNPAAQSPCGPPSEHGPRALIRAYSGQGHNKGGDGHGDIQADPS